MTEHHYKHKCKYSDRLKAFRPILKPVLRLKCGQKEQFLYQAKEILISNIGDKVEIPIRIKHPFPTIFVL